MAQLPQIEQYQPHVPAEGRLQFMPEAQPAPLGEGAMALGSALETVDRAQSASYAGAQLADLRLRTFTALQQAKDTAQQNPQVIDGFTPNVLASFDKDAEALRTASRTNPIARQMLEPHLQELREHLAQESLQYEASARVANRTQSALTAGKQAASSVELSPNTWQQAGNEQIAALNALGLPPEQRLMLGRQIDNWITESAGRGFAKQDPTGTLTRLNDPHDALFSGMTPESRQAVTAYAKQQFVDQRATAIQGIYETAGTTAGVKALAAIDKDSSIPPELRDPIRDKVNQQVNALRDQRREQYAPQIAQLEGNIESDRAGPPDKASAWSLYERGALNPTQFASAIGGIERSQLAALKQGISLEAARQAYAAGTPLDPEHPAVKHGVGLLFSDLTQNVAPGSPEYVNRATDVTTKVGVAPEPAISWARTSLVGGDPKSAASAADLVARLDEANPRAMPYALDPKTKAIAGTINEAVRSGADPQVAVEMARRNASMGDADVKTLNERWRQSRAKDGQPLALLKRLESDDRFKPALFSSVPQIPTAMQSEFDALTQDYYRFTGGDVQQARERAASDLKHIWGISEVNGKRELMPYAPEAMFPGLTAEVIREDIAHTVASEPALAGHDASKVQLIPDPQRTARTQGSEWNLAAPDKNGLRDVLRGPDGNPLIYQLPVTQEGYDAVKERVNAAAMEKARQMQANRKAYEEGMTEVSLAERANHRLMEH